MNSKILVINEQNNQLEELASSEIFLKCKITDAIEIIKNEKIDIIILDREAVGADKFKADLLETINLANRDSLTNLYNRNYFNSKAKQILSTSINKQLPLSLVMIDLDGFKAINDQYGHLFGDRVLKHIAKILQSSIREEDILARFGGDEFILLLPNASITNALLVIKRIKQNLVNSCLASSLTEASAGDRGCSKFQLPSFSFGIASFNNEDETIEELINIADKDLYKGKLTSSR